MAAGGGRPHSAPPTRDALAEPVVPDPAAPGAPPDPERVATGAGSARHAPPATPAPGGDKHLADLTLDVLVYAPTGLLLMAVEEFPELAAKGRRRINRQLDNARFIGRMAVTVGGRELRQRVEVLTSNGPAPATPSDTGRTSGAAGRPAQAGAEGRGPRSGPSPAVRSTPGRSATGSAPAPRSTAADRDLPTVPGTPTGASRAHSVVPPVTAPPKTQPKTAPAKAAPAGTAPPGGAPTAGGGTTADQGRPAPPAVRPGPAASGRAEERPRVDLAIPGYDTLSASQVVRRLDSLGRPELVAVERYEAGSRHRRTILHRVAQLLGEEEAPGSPGG